MKSNLNLSDVVNEMRILKAYRYDPKKREVICTIHLCSIDNANDIFRKLSQNRQSVIAIAKGSSWCDNCRLTACWDKGKAITCNIKKEA